SLYYCHNCIITALLPRNIFRCLPNLLWSFLVPCTVPSGSISRWNPVLQYSCLLRRIPFRCVRSDGVLRDNLSADTRCSLISPGVSPAGVKTKCDPCPKLSRPCKEKARPFDFEEGDVYMSSHEQRFRLFSSVEYEGQLYMTPQNFIESVTMSEPRNKKPWMSLTKQELEKILVDTPAVWQGTSKLFRNLRERGRD
uniref:Uncharacterized protein n=1 Tax=Hucho hucho TaxID=62062 RepID=A0A4W5KGG2_9TELE